MTISDDANDIQPRDRKIEVYKIDNSPNSEDKADDEEKSGEMESLRGERARGEDDERGERIRSQWVSTYHETAVR